MNINVVSYIKKSAWSLVNFTTFYSQDPIGQGSATFNVKRAILAPFLPNKIHVEPQNIWCPNIDNMAYN